jgi:exoribonuclease R
MSVRQTFLKAHEHPALYRIHEGPTPEKLEALRTFMGEVGFGVGGGEKPHAKDYGKLMKQIKERPDAQLCKQCCCARCNKPFIAQIMSAILA